MTKKDPNTAIAQDGIGIQAKRGSEAALKKLNHSMTVAEKDSSSCWKD